MIKGILYERQTKREKSNTEKTEYTWDWQQAVACIYYIGFCYRCWTYSDDCAGWDKAGFQAELGFDTAYCFDFSHI